MDRLTTCSNDGRSLTQVLIRARGEQAWRRERGQESRRAMEDKEDGCASLFPHQIVDFTPAPATAPAQPVLSRTFPHPPTLLHCRIR